MLDDKHAIALKGSEATTGLAPRGRDRDTCVTKIQYKSNNW